MELFGSIQNKINFKKKVKKDINCHDMKQYVDKIKNLC